MKFKRKRFGKGNKTFKSSQPAGFKTSMQNRKLMRKQRRQEKKQNRARYHMSLLPTPNPSTWVKENNASSPNKISKLKSFVESEKNKMKQKENIIGNKKKQKENLQEFSDPEKQESGGFIATSSLSDRMARLQEFVNRESGSQGAAQDHKFSKKKENGKETPSSLKKENLIKDKQALKNLRKEQKDDMKEINKYAKLLGYKKPHQKKKVAPIFADDFGSLLDDIEAGDMASAENYKKDEAEVELDSEDEFSKDFEAVLGGGSAKRKKKKAKSEEIDDDEVDKEFDALENEMAMGDEEGEDGKYDTMPDMYESNTLDGSDPDDDDFADDLYGEDGGEDDYDMPDEYEDDVDGYEAEEDNSENGSYGEEEGDDDDGEEEEEGGEDDDGEEEEEGGEDDEDGFIDYEAEEVTDEEESDGDGILEHDPSKEIEYAFEGGSGYCKPEILKNGQENDIDRYSSNSEDDEDLEDFVVEDDEVEFDKDLSDELPEDEFSDELSTSPVKIKKRRIVMSDDDDDDGKDDGNDDVDGDVDDVSFISCSIQNKLSKNEFESNKKKKSNQISSSSSDESKNDDSKLTLSKVKEKKKKKSHMISNSNEDETEDDLQHIPLKKKRKKMKTSKISDNTSEENEINNDESTELKKRKKKKKQLSGSISEDSNCTSSSGTFDVSNKQGEACLVKKIKKSNERIIKTSSKRKLSCEDDYEMVERSGKKVRFDDEGEVERNTEEDSEEGTSAAFSEDDDEPAASIRKQPKPIDKENEEEDFEKGSSAAFREDNEFAAFITKHPEPVNEGNEDEDSEEGTSAAFSEDDEPAASIRKQPKPIDKENEEEDFEEGSSAAFRKDDKLAASITKHPEPVDEGNEEEDSEGSSAAFSEDDEPAASIRERPKPADEGNKDGDSEEGTSAAFSEDDDETAAFAREEPRPAAENLVNVQNTNKKLLKEDIYGRLRDEDGNIINEKTEQESNGGKYIPPAVRKLMALENKDAKKKEQLAQLKKTLKGLFNRLGESNMAGIANQIEGLYLRHSRNDMNDVLTSILIESIVGPTLTPERLAQEHALMVAVLSANVGSEIGAHILNEFVLRWSDRLEETPLGQDTEGTKELDNLLLFIANLYNFRVMDAPIIYDILNKLASGFTPKEIELILLLLRNVGFTLRKDDPLALKELITKIQAQASASQTKDVEKKSGSTEFSRVTFMLEVVQAIRNNNMSKVPNYDPSQVEHLKKVLRGLVRPGKQVAKLNLTLNDLLKSRECGRWWIVGSAWSGVLPGEKPPSDSRQVDGKMQTKGKKNLESEFSEIFKQKAAKLQLSRPPRINILYIITEGSEDYLDAFEKLLDLNLSANHERDLFNVILLCCQKGKVYNPFYAHLTDRMCKFDKKYKRLLQFSLWDKFQEMENLKIREVTNLSKFLTHLLGESSLNLSILKHISFMDAESQMISFLRQLLIALLLHPTGAEVVERVFSELGASPKLEVLQQSLRIFILKFLKSKNLKENDNYQLLSKRIEMVTELLNKRGGVRL